MTLDVTHWGQSEEARREYLRHNYLARRGPSYSRPTIPTGQKVRAGLGYAPTQKLMPNLGKPWTHLGRS